MITLEPTTEAIMIVYSENNLLKTRYNEDVNLCELIGLLTIELERLKKEVAEDKKR